MRALGVWLCVVAFFRLSSVFFGYFKPWALKAGVFSKSEVTSVHGRTFAAWTAVTCVLCVLTALDLDCQPLYLATLLSFVVAGVHFALEYAVYRTMALKNLATVGFFAGVSFVWMLLEFPPKQAFGGADGDD